MKSTDSEPQGGGMELEQYRTSLEQMVEEKSKDLIAIQENLEATNRRQALFIKVLQILQLEPDIPTAMNMALAEIGRYTGVDRLATWEPPRRSYVWLHQRMVQRRYRTRYRLLAEYDH
jgi:hypothetical protein